MARYRQTFTEAMQQVALTEKEVSKLKNTDAFKELEQYVAEFTGA